MKYQMNLYNKRKNEYTSYFRGICYTDTKDLVLDSNINGLLAIPFERQNH